ncbi:MAG: inositol monophosphatase [Elusimicrobia bacterium]|nr:inositol monophosphatase [Elusimicrobiota bacterium]
MRLLRSARNDKTEERREFLLQTTLDAGALLLQYFGKIGLAHAQSKENISINVVSQADLQSQELVVRRIRKSFAGESILAEEGDLAKKKKKLEKGSLWVLDPLDGTVNFLHGFPYFGVSLAYCHDGVPLIGAVYDPVRGELFWAEKGKGAYLESVEFRVLSVELKKKKKLRVTNIKKLADALMVTGFGYDRHKRADFYLAYYKAFLTRCHDVRRAGAAALDLAWIAAGRADGFWEWQLNPWDVAAGQILVEEAGGRITHLDGSPYSIFHSEETLASNGNIHDECLKAITTVVRV